MTSIVRKTMDALQQRLATSPAARAQVTNAFHTLYYQQAEANKTWASTHFLGVPVLKCPFDLWLYQELLFRLQPDLIIEAGTFLGGSAFYFATLCDLLGKGEIVTIDIEDGEVSAQMRKYPPEKIRPAHPRITYVKGSSTDPAIVADMKQRAAKAETVLVILDSDHSKAHVLREMECYHSLVTPGSYMVVEDGNVNGHPVRREFGPGPYEAVLEFLERSDEFERDQILEDTHLFTFNPHGYLRKVASR